jgi:virulence activator alpha
MSPHKYILISIYYIITKYKRSIYFKYELTHIKNNRSPTKIKSLTHIKGNRKQVTIDHIKKLHLRSLEMHKCLEKIKNDLTPIAGPELYRFLTLKSGILHAEATIKWREDALERLQHEK